MQPRTLTTTLALFAAMLPVTAQQVRPAAPVHQRTAAPATPARLPDAVIEANIRAKMAKSKIGADKFRFKVQGGVATIEGKTDVIQHKGAATRMAKTAGAVAVSNHIEISDAAKQKAEDNLEKGRRRAQIKRGDARSAPETPRQATAKAPPAAKSKTATSSAVQKQ